MAKQRMISQFLSIKTKNSHCAHFSWGSFYDPESELSGYKICLGKSQGECDEIDNVPVGLNTTYSFHNLSLRHEEKYFVSVTASNMVGLSTKITSNSIKVDLTPPKPAGHMSGSSNGVCNGVFGSCDEQTLPGNCFFSFK